MIIGMIIKTVVSRHSQKSQFISVRRLKWFFDCNASVNVICLISQTWVYDWSTHGAFGCERTRPIAPTATVCSITATAFLVWHVYNMLNI